MKSKWTVGLRSMISKTLNLTRRISAWSPTATRVLGSPAKGNSHRRRDERSTTEGGSLQRERPYELIRRINRQVTPVWNPRHRGYDVRGIRKRIGFVRFNVAGSKANRLCVYVVTGSYVDPRGWFSSASRADMQALCFIDPDEEDALAYVAQVLESAFDQQ